jgi:3-oxoacyl-[acyl-carrier-protein] synthase I
MTSDVSTEDPIVVSGVSAVSPVGHSAEVTFASVRARLSRIGVSTDLRIRNDRGKLMPITCAAVAGITDGHRRYLRHFRMAVRAFAQLLVDSRLGDHIRDHTMLHLVLAEPERPGMDDRVQHELVRKMTRVLDIPDMSGRTTVTRIGHAGVFEAISAAAGALVSRRVSRVLIGGVDGYLDELTLEWLNDTGRLKTEDNSKGFIPGEAAAFIVLERRSAVETRGGVAMARLAGVGTALEANGIYEKTACTGEGLTMAIRSAREASGDLPLALAICDLNGERYRANEWGFTLPRSFDGSPPASLWHPADCLGDCGAAAGVLNMVFATLALARQAVGDSSVLVWGSSDDGERGAAVLSAAAADLN